MSERIESAPTDREIFVWNAMYGWYRTKSYEIDGHRVWPLYGIFGSEGGVWYPVPTYWMELPPSPTGQVTCNHFGSAEFHDKRDRAERAAASKLRANGAEPAHPDDARPAKPVASNGANEQKGD